MGTYWKVVNLDKGEFVCPYAVGADVKIHGMIHEHPGVGAALILLCADTGNMSKLMWGIHEYPEIKAVADRVVGKWAADRVALIPDFISDIYDKCYDGTYKDISNDVATVIEWVFDGKFMGDGWKHFEFKDGRDLTDLESGFAQFVEENSGVLIRMLDQLFRYGDDYKEKLFSRLQKDEQRVFHTLRGWFVELGEKSREGKRAKG